MNKLIINADDFGLCKSVNEAIIDCFLKRNLTSATLMVNTKSSEEAIELAKKYSLPIGLHFNLVRGKSLSGISTLTDNDNNFFSRKELFKKIIKNQINPNDIQKEFIAQINFLNHENISFTHFDSDNHSHFNPLVLRVLKKYILEKNIKLRKINPLNLCNPFINLTRNVKQIYFKLICLFFWNKNFQSNNFMTSIYDLNTLKDLKKDDYLYLINTKKKNITLELMVHPYKDSNELSKIYKTNKEKNFVENCLKEYKILSNDHGLFLEKNYQLSNFNDFISS